MITNTETRQFTRCQRCGGQLMRFYDDVSCLQCGYIEYVDITDRYSSLLKVETQPKTPKRDLTPENWPSYKLVGGPERGF